MYRSDFDAGDGQRIVVYQAEDTGEELNSTAIYAFIAEDAARLAGLGLRIVTMTSTALRHAGVAFGNNGSGYETKASVAVVYASLFGAGGGSVGDGPGA